jgi:hypothetical protein
MASPRFLEILRCNGVDQGATPHPGMIVPFLGENQVILETSGFDVEVQNSALKLQEFDGRELTTQLLRGVQDALSKSDVDPQQRDAFMPDTTWNQPRFFRVLGTIKTGFPGTVVNVVQRKARAASIALKLQVAVVERMVIKVAIRHVRARCVQGRMRFTASGRAIRPGSRADECHLDAADECCFELVPSGDVDVDQNDAKTSAALGKASGLKALALFARVDGLGRQELGLVRAEGPGAQMTFFVVHKLHTGGDPVYGRGARYRTAS